MQSGLALAQWALTPHPVQQAFLIARRAGFRGTDRHELVAYLKKLSAGDLTRIAEEALDDQAEVSIRTSYNSANSLTHWDPRKN